MNQKEGHPANGLMDYAEAIANFSLEGLAAKLQGSLETGRIGPFRRGTVLA